jgi:hypothetical protein
MNIYFGPPGFERDWTFKVEGNTKDIDAVIVAAKGLARLRIRNPRDDDGFGILRRIYDEGKLAGVVLRDRSTPWREIKNRGLRVNGKTLEEGEAEAEKERRLT